MDDSFENLGEEIILTLLWLSGASSATVCFVISLLVISIYYWLFKCGVLRIVCVCVCVFACVHIHTSIITVSVTRLISVELMGKLRIINLSLYIYFESWSSRYCVTFPTAHVVFGQSQCTGSVGQSEQTPLVRRRGFVERERRGIEDLQ